MCVLAVIKPQVTLINVLTLLLTPETEKRLTVTTHLNQIQEKANTRETSEEINTSL